jgi:phospholipid/cholesterol/gamma-HCH transport system ATP-binding protein
MIRANGVKKAFGEKVVLHGIDAEFQSGQVNFIIGRSGSGKSVLTKCMVGLLEVDSGRVQYGDSVFSELNRRDREAVRREIGMLFQGGALFDSMTVLENVEFPLRMFSDMAEDERKERAMECLRRVELLGAEHLFPAEVSGGMQKRVALARAIVGKPKYLFCDEPNSGLDPQTAIIIDNLIKDLTQEYGTTTVVISHDMNSVIEIGDSIHFLHEGRVAWQGDRQGILDSGVSSLDQFVYASDLMKDIRNQLRRK